MKSLYFALIAFILISVTAGSLFGMEVTPTGEKPTYEGKFTISKDTNVAFASRYYHEQALDSNDVKASSVPIISGEFFILHKESAKSYPWNISTKYAQLPEALKTKRVPCGVPLIMLIDSKGELRREGDTFECEFKEFKLKLTCEVWGDVNFHTRVIEKIVAFSKNIQHLPSRLMKDIQLPEDYDSYYVAGELIDAGVIAEKNNKWIHGENSWITQQLNLMQEILDFKVKELEEPEKVLQPKQEKIEGHMTLTDEPLKLVDGALNFTVNISISGDIEEIKKRWQKFIVIKEISSVGNKHVICADWSLKIFNKLNSLRNILSEPCDDYYIELNQNGLIKLSFDENFTSTLTEKTSKYHKSLEPKPLKTIVNNEVLIQQPPEKTSQPKAIIGNMTLADEPLKLVDGILSVVVNIQTSGDIKQIKHLLVRDNNIKEVKSFGNNANDIRATIPVILFNEKSVDGDSIGENNYLMLSFDKDCIPKLNKKKAEYNAWISGIKNSHLILGLGTIGLCIVGVLLYKKVPQFNHCMHYVSEFLTKKLRPHLF